MLAGALITIREGLEAFLIVGIMLAYLNKVGQEAFKRYVWIGASAGVLLSVALALAFYALAVRFAEGPGAPLFEAFASAAAVPILSYMVLWMQRHARTLKGEIERRTESAVLGGEILVLVALPFVTVLREGLETAVFLTAITTRATGQNPLPGAFLGLLVAASIAYAYFYFAVRLNLRRFFIVTGVFLIFLAAGLMAHIFMALHEVGFPTVVDELWSTKHILDGESLAGRILHAFMGYHDEPSLLQALAYFGYLGGMGYAFLHGLGAVEVPKILSSARSIFVRRTRA